MNKHDVVCKLKDLASELGRTPSRDEFRAICPEHQIRKLFGTYSVLLQSIGIDSKKKEKSQIKQISTEIQICESINEYKQKREIKISNYTKIVILGDIHFPWCDANAISMVYAILSQEKPDIVIQIGDLMDLYSQSRFPRSLNVYTPETEESLGFKMSQEMWYTINKIVPNAKKFQLIGNHDIRPLKNVIQKWPEGEHWIKEVFKSKFTFEAVRTIYDPTEELIIDDIAIIHGYLSSLGQHRDYAQMNVITGHSHRGGVSYRPLKNKTLWELNVGFLGDPYSKALSYRPQKIHNWTVGMGIVDKYGPRFIHF